MQIDVHPYPENINEHPDNGLIIEVLQPQKDQVVMGASGKWPKEVHAEAMLQDGVALFKRKGGGGTVLLGQNTIVVTIHAEVAHRFRNLAYFKALNNAMSDVFRKWGNHDYRTRGISDIAVEDRKIVGTSIYRRRNYLLYQASILVELNKTGINRYLQHPPKEPDYRAGRSHDQFLTSLRELGITRSYETMLSDLRKFLPELVRKQLKQTDEASSDAN